VRTVTVTMTKYLEVNTMGMEITSLPVTCRWTTHFPKVITNHTTIKLASTLKI